MLVAFTSIWADFSASRYMGLSVETLLMGEIGKSILSISTSMQ